MRHYTPVLPVLFLSGGLHLFQDKFRNRGILGVLFSKIPRFANRGILTVLFFKIPRFANRGILGVLFFKIPRFVNRGILRVLFSKMPPCLQTILLLWFGSRGESCHLPVTRVARYRHYSPFVVWINELKFCSTAKIIPVRDKQG